MAKEKEDNAKKDCNCENKCECSKDCKCGCNCGCCCGCSCKKIIFKLIALTIVFLAGVGFGCILCCGCGKGRHHIPAHFEMAKHSMHKQPKNSVIVIKTDGNEIIPVVSDADKDYRNFRKHGPKHHHRLNLGMPNAPVAPETENSAPTEPVAPAESNTPAAEPVAPAPAPEAPATPAEQ